MAGKSFRRKFAGWRFSGSRRKSGHARAEGMPVSAHFRWTVLWIRLSFGSAREVGAGGSRGASALRNGGLATALIIRLEQKKSRLARTGGGLFRQKPEKNAC